MHNTDKMMLEEKTQKDATELLPMISELFLDPLLYSRDLSAGSSPDVYDSFLLESSIKTPKAGVDKKEPRIDEEGDGDQVLMSGAGGGSGGRKSSEPSRPGTSSSDATRTSSSQRPGSQSNPSRRQQGRPPPFSSSPPFYPSTAADGFQVQTASASQQPPPPQYSASRGNAYVQRGGFVGQYTMPAQPPVPMQHQYAYSHQLHHPGLRASDASIAPQYPTMSYSSASLAPPPQGRGPMYQYQPYPPDANAPSSPFSTNAPSSSSGYDHPSSSNPPHSSQSGPPPAHYPQSHPSASFPSLHYPTITTTHQFAPYPTDSFAQNSPSLYPSQYTPPYPYAISPSPQEDNHGQVGTWWYIPQGAPSPAPTAGSYDASHPAYTGVYHHMGFAPMARPELDRYGNPTSPLFPSSPSHHTSRQPPPPSHHQPASPLVLGSGPMEGSSLRAPSSVSVQEGSSHGALSPAVRDSPILAPQSSSGGDGTSASSTGHPAMRMSYHPHPPPNRSEWVMWVGNVPSDATHDEIWRFFNQPPLPGMYPPVRSTEQLLPAGLLSPDSERDPYADAKIQIWGGVSSVFLISRSNCAFVNFDSEAHLEQAVRRFNGQPVRPQDPRCARLVCRVRRRDDDLRAGVGAQRGMGMHTRWVKDHKEEKPAQEHEARVQDPPRTPSERGTSSLSASVSPPVRSTSSDDDARLQSPHGRSPTHHSSSSGSYASTNSGFLTRHFPKRYFILKSLSEDDLHISAQRGMWATQPHNEGILNQAFRTSMDVFLIFGANKSGEFFGYARMNGPITKGEETVSWTSRSTRADPSHSPSASLSSGVGRQSKVSETIPEEGGPSEDRTPGPSLLFSPSEHRLAEESPAPVTPGEEGKMLGAVHDPRTPHASGSKGTTDESAPRRRPAQPRLHASAPTEQYLPHRKITYQQGAHHPETFDIKALRPVTEVPDLPKSAQDFELDANALANAQKARGLARAETVQEEDSAKRRDSSINPEFRTRSAPDTVTLGEGEGPSAPDPRGVESWGTPFKVQWIRTTRLPFYRTRHLRNPWNHDREVKVSRDGTEIEPTVGQMLLDEWDKPEFPASPTATVSGSARRGSGARSQARVGAAGQALSPTQRVLPRSEGGRFSQGGGGGGGGGAGGNEGGRS